MNTSYGVNSYMSHDLNITMKTSSGDTIKMDFSNQESASFTQQKDENATQTEMKFSSMQSFSFSVDSNGIDEQDQKEIDAYMKIAQPYIDSFLQEFESVAPSSPVSKMAQDIVSAFEPSKERDTNTNNYIKTNIVEMFDNSTEKITKSQTTSQDSIEQLLKDAQDLLERTLYAFDDYNTKIYA